MPAPALVLGPYIINSYKDSYLTNFFLIEYGMKIIARFCETINILGIKNNIGQRFDNTIFKKKR